jgi:hypothetical protein
VRETPGRRAAATLALLLTSALAAAGCPASPPAPTEAASAAPPPSSSPSPAAEAPLAPAAEAPPAFVGAAHILVAYKGALGVAKTVSRTKADAKTRADEARAKLVAQPGTFEELVVKYSDDEISRPAAGKIGNFERNVFPPAFSDAAFGMAVGGISEVVETPRGFHVIVRTK